MDSYIHIWKEEEQWGWGAFGTYTLKGTASTRDEAISHAEHTITAMEEHNRLLDDWIDKIPKFVTPHGKEMDDE